MCNVQSSGRRRPPGCPPPHVATPPLGRLHLISQTRKEVTTVAPGKQASARGFSHLGHLCPPSWEQVLTDAGSAHAARLPQRIRGAGASARAECSMHTTWKCPLRSAEGAPPPGKTVNLSPFKSFSWVFCHSKKTLINTQPQVTWKMGLHQASEDAPVTHGETGRRVGVSRDGAAGRALRPGFLAPGSAPLSSLPPAYLKRGTLQVGEVVKLLQHPAGAWSWR